MAEDDEPAWLARIRFREPGSAIELRRDGTWHGLRDDEKTKLRAAYAQLVSRPPLHEYSPSDGEFGRRLGRLVSQALGGKLELPPISMLPNGAIP